jgi:hypothetical protein
MMRATLAAKRMDGEVSMEILCAGVLEAEAWDKSRAG